MCILPKAKVGDDEFPVEITLCSAIVVRVEAN